MIYPPTNEREILFFLGLAVRELIISGYKGEELGVLTKTIWGLKYGNNYHTSKFYLKKDGFLKEHTAKAIIGAGERGILKIKFDGDEQGFFFQAWAGGAISRIWDNYTLTSVERNTIFLAKEVLNNNKAGISKRGLMEKMQDEAKTRGIKVLGDNELEGFLPALNVEYLNLEEVRGSGTEIYTPLKTK